MGYILAPERLTSGIRKMHDFLTVGAPAPLQEAAAVALALPDSYYEGLRKIYLAKKDLLWGILTEAGFDPYRPQGAYYILCNLDRFGCENDVEFARYLVQEVGVAAVPGSSFYHEPGLGRNQIRFTFSKKEETLLAAGQRLKKVHGRLKTSS
ncbi:MAG: aminotransferase class I/II-fold pyridoxal phosphate-dependent enzyme [Nitrospinae bacterium]|nr:aminotransferase class I/II-fold pyridoxal phosphate-dependent enzyme [Nitrospinota bacterium]